MTKPRKYSVYGVFYCLRRSLVGSSPLLGTKKRPPEEVFRGPEGKEKNYGQQLVLLQTFEHDLPVFVCHFSGLRPAIFLLPCFDGCFCVRAKFSVER